jgi:hypothetical protein
MGAMYVCMYVTCLEHGLHRIADNIRAQFPALNDLIARGKTVSESTSSRPVLQRGSSAT